MANYSEMTHAELVTLCSKQQAHISSLNEQVIRMRWGKGQENDKLKEENKKLRREVNTMGEGEEAHLCKIAFLQRELDGFKSVCNEYLESEDSSWKELSSWCDQKTDEITELKDEGGNYQYDLEELQGELEPLEEFMSDLTGVCSYEDVIDYIKGLQEKLDEGSEQHMKDTKKLNEFVEKNYVPKNIHEVSIKQVSDLMEQVVQLKKVVQQRAFRIIELENDLESTTNYWKSKYENEEGVNQMLRDAIDVAAVKLEQYEAGDNSI